jgi:hypothetical protein
MIYRRLSAFIGGPKHLLCGLATNFERSSRLADKKAVLNLGVQLNYIRFNETQY